MNWEILRNEDKSINLVRAYIHAYGQESTNVFNFLRNVEQLHPIKSRQAAAIALATAYAIWGTP